MIELIGWGAVVLTASQQLPQVVRTTRTRDLAGVSMGMFALMVAQAGAWTGYGFRKDLLPPIITNIVLTTCGVLMLREFRRSRAPRIDTVIAITIGALIVELMVFLWLPTAVLGAIAASMAFVLLWPQVIATLRSDDLSGLSSATWWLSAAGTVLWVTYGIGRGATLLWLSAAQGLALSLVILARIAMVRRSASIAVLAADRPVS